MRKHLPHYFTSLFRILIIIITSVLLLSCPDEIDDSIATIARDTLAPTISITSPEEQGFFRASLTISGTIIDKTSEEKADGTVVKESLTWEILNKSTYKGTFTLADSGAFCITVDTADLNETIVVRIYASDISGNSGYKDLTLLPYREGCHISITEPFNNMEWENIPVITVLGTITNGIGSSATDEVDFSTLEVMVTAEENSTAKPENLTCNETTGAFSFTFDTGNISARQAITVSVSDKNDNSSSETIYILSGSSGPHMEVTAPDDLSIYNRVVDITGFIRNSSLATDGTGGVEKIEISVIGSTIGATLEKTGTSAEGVPVFDETVTGTDTTVSYDCDDTDSSEIYPDADPPVSDTTVGDFTFSFPTNGLSGDIIVFIRSENINGNESTYSLNLRDDDEGPCIEVLSPANNSLYESTVTVTGTIRNNTVGDTGLDEISSLEWSVPGTAISGSDLTWDGTTGAFSFSFTVPDTTSGTLTVKITGEDINSNIEEKYITLLDDRLGPTITVATPDSNSTFGYGDNSIAVSGTILNSRNDAGSGLEITSAGWEIIPTSSGLSGTITPVADGSFSFNFSSSGITDNTVILRISAVANDGYSATSDTILQNDNLAPIVTISAPSEFDYYGTSISFAGSYTDGNGTAAADDDISSIQWEILGVSPAVNGTVSSPFTGSFSVSGIDASEFRDNKTIRITAQDMNGNTSVTACTLLDNRSGPQISVTAPSPDSFFGEGDNIITVSGTILDSEGSAGSGASVPGASWEIVGAVPAVGDILAGSGSLLPSDGSFSFNLNTADITDSSVILRISASGADGYVSNNDITLYNDNLAPDISFISPDDLSYYGDSIDFSATVLDGNNTASVTDDISAIVWEIIGTTTPVTLTGADLDSSSSFSVTGIDSSAYEGNKTIRITATDVNGNSSVETILLIDDGSGPQITVSSPENNSAYGGGSNTVTVTGTILNAEGDAGSGTTITDASWEVLNASPAVDGILAESGSLLPSDGSFSFNLSTDGMTASSITVRISATGSDGHNSTYDLVLTNDYNAPVINITSPESMDDYTDSVTVTGTILDADASAPYTSEDIDDISSAAWSVIGTSLSGTITPGSDGSFTISNIDFSTSSGNKTIRITAEDNNGNTATENLTLQDNMEGPNFIMIQPADNSAFGAGNNQLMVSGQVQNSSGVYDSGLSNLNYLIVGQTSAAAFTQDGSGNFTFWINTTDITASSVTLQLSATGTDGHTGTQDIVLVNDSLAPVIEITSPQEMDYYGSSISFTGSYQNGDGMGGVTDISAVSWEIIGESLSGSFATIDGMILVENIDSSGFTGSKIFRVTATDKNGNTAICDRTLQDDRDGPQITIAAPPEYSTFGRGTNSVTVTGTILNAEGEAGSGGSIPDASWEVVGSSPAVGGILAESGTPLPADGRYSFAVNTDGIEDSTITIRITAEGAEGHESTADLTLENDNLAPVINFTSPGELDYYYDTISFSGVYEDGNSTAAVDDDISYLSWTLLGSGTVTEIPAPYDGTFSVSGIDSSVLTGSQIIQVTVVDDNGNSASETLTLQDQTEGPVISIDDPGCYPYYDLTFDLSGNISHTGGLGQVVQTSGALQWAFDKAPTTWTNFTIDGSGDFTISGINTYDRSGSQSITLRAEDLNGDVTEERIVLLNDGVGLDVTVDSPSSGDSFATALPVQLTISDYDELFVNPGSVTWELAGQSASG